MNSMAQAGSVATDGAPFAEASGGADPVPDTRKPGAGTAGHIQPLDGLRGVAALSVLLHHAWVGNSHGWMLVDFFFCLSGFVIAKAYERKLGAGLPLWRYMGLRLLRIYPMLFIGGVIGLLFWRSAEGSALLLQMSTATFALVYIAHCLFVPFVAQKHAFPFNVSQWSIFYELLANLIHALLVPVLSKRVLIGIVALSGLYMVVATLMIGTMNWGFERDHIEVGLARTAYSFFLGVFLFRIQDRLIRRLPSVGFWWLAAVILVLASIPSLVRPFPVIESLRQIVTVLAVNPAIVALGLTCPTRGTLIRWLGVLSFPLYAIHAPLVFYAHALMEAKFSGLMLKAAMLGWCVPIALAALLLGIYVDLPLNRLRRKVA